MIRRIGLWVAYGRPDLPNPQDLVDSNWDAEERWKVASYLSCGTIASVYRGHSKCRICGFFPNGNMELTDGVFLWPEGLAHYVRDHAVRLPPPIVEHALRRRAEIASTIIDEEWWGQATSL